MTVTSRRNFLKSAGLITAAAAIINPFELFSQNREKTVKSGSKKWF